MVTPSGPRFGELQQPALSREREFKAPEDWVGLGAALQAPHSGSGRVVSVRMGVDFGTAYTKVAIRVADKVFFVPWSGTRESDVAYLLPGELSRLDGDSMWLGRSPVAEEVLSGLKLPFLTDHASSPAQQAATVAFLALVLRYARGWLYRTHPSLVKGRRLAWQLNLGCPTNSWSSGLPRRAYEEVAARAWQLSLSEGVIYWSDATSLLSSSRVALANIGLDGLHLMPEFVAQIAGYVRSPQRRDGLHLLMDVGAGTVDLATFNIFHDKASEEDRYPIFASDVLPLGTHFLMAARLQSLASVQREWDDLKAIPGEHELAALLNVDRQRLEAADREFEMWLRQEIGRVLSYTRSRRYVSTPATPSFRR